MSDQLLNKTGVPFPSEEDDRARLVDNFLAGQVSMETAEAAMLEIKWLRQANEDLNIQVGKYEHSVVGDFKREHDDLHQKVKELEERNAENCRRVADAAQMLRRALSPIEHHLTSVGIDVQDIQRALRLYGRDNQVKALEEFSFTKHDAITVLQQISDASYSEEDVELVMGELRAAEIALGNKATSLKMDEESSL